MTTEQGRPQPSGPRDPANCCKTSARTDGLSCRPVARISRPERRRRWSFLPDQPSTRYRPRAMNRRPTAGAKVDESALGQRDRVVRKWKNGIAHPSGENPSAARVDGRGGEALERCPWASQAWLGLRGTGEGRRRHGGTCHPGRSAVDVSGRDGGRPSGDVGERSEEHTSELQSRSDLVCRLLLEKKKKKTKRKDREKKKEKGQRK